MKTKKTETAKITGFVFSRGCDQPNKYQFAYDGEIDIAREEADIEAAKTLGWQEVCEIAKKYKGKFTEATWDSYGGYEFDKSNVKVVIEAAKEKLDKKNKAEKEEAEEAKNERDSKFAEAKKTGKPVFLRSQMIECNDSRQDCSFDTLSTFLLADGTEKTSRRHCY